MSAAVGYLSPLRVLAELYDTHETQTAQGGRAVDHVLIGQAWLVLSRGARTGGVEAGEAVSRPTARARVRADPRLTPGRILSFGGGDWAIRDRTPDESPGWIELDLERTR